MGTSAGAVEPTVLLLGPVEVTGGGTALAPRERALLACLALDAGRMVGLDRLVDDLWGEAPPASARNALQVYVSHLRAALGKQAVVSMGGGYRLEVPADRVDALVFERLVAVALGQRSGGRPKESIATLDTAFRLWRGEALADLGDYAFAVVEAARLRELRATAVEHLAESLLEIGDLDRLTDQLAPMVRAFPFRERLRAAVMTGLYRQGRAVDALALYAEVVDQLRDELGLEPGPTLRALQHAILSDSPSLVDSELDALPTGELTLVATALESPAALEARLGELYADVVLEQRDVLRDAFAAHRGLTVPSDAERLLAAFPTAVDAAHAADAAHRALAEHTFPSGTPVRVRVGVHTGTPRVVDRHYAGVDLHRVVQVSLAASGGQTLLTAEAAARLADDDGLHVIDLGTHRLPDLALPERLRQTSTVADEQFPPPRTLGARSSLPRAAVPLVGRDDLLAEIVREVTAKATRVVTLVGPGGTGKTRLAVEVARSVGETTAGGVYFVPLESARSDEDVWTGVASALGLPAEARTEAAVLDRLATQHALLVLDNLEQLDRAGVVVEALLDAGAGVTLLTTSRRPTGVAGERVHQVAPLTDGVGGGDASELFARCAELARPGFVLDDHSRDAVARICRRVDGLPLGIELAAARVRQLPPYALAVALDDGLGLVTGGPSRPERQRDLHALTAWSVDLLAPHQVALLEQLAVFAGGVDLDLVARLPLPDGGGVHDPVAAALDLADASLVRVSEDDRPRVTLLETIREHALTRLRATGRLGAARDTHLTVLLDLARRLHPRLASQDRVAPVVLRERQNLEAALDHALAAGPQAIEAAAEILVCLADSWHQLGSRAFDYVGRISAALPADSPHRGWMTYWNYRRTWDTEVDEKVVLAALRTAEAELRAGRDQAALAALLGYGTDLGVDVGLGTGWGVGRAQEAVDIARDLGEDWLLARVLASQARSLIDAGREDDARGPLAEAQRAASRTQDLHRLDLLTLTEAELLARSGRRGEAWHLARSAALGLVATRHDGTLWVTSSRLARLAAADRPGVAATLAGIGLGALARMGSVPAPADLERLYAGVAEAVDALGRADFDALVADGRAMGADGAATWVDDVLEHDAR